MTIRATVIVMAALAAGSVQAGEVEIMAATAARPLLIEGVARAADGGLLVSSVHTARVGRLAVDGALTLFGPEAEQAVFGMVADPARNALWTAVSPTLHDTATDRPAALVRRDLTTGEIVARYPAPAPAEPLDPPAMAHVFGDVALGPDGAVYVVDNAANAILVLRPDADGLTVLEALGERASPQGMVVSPDGTALVIASYSRGLARIPLAGGASSLLTAPAETELRGIDGLVRHGDRIVAIQNGTRTHRVLLLTLDAGWTAVTDRQVLAEGLVEPTTGFVEDGALIFVARSQWSDFLPGGEPNSPAPEGAVIGRLALP